MFEFLHSIFGYADQQHGVYPEALVKEAIERAVDGTDPRMRILPGYAKQLRAPVIHAIDHVIALVDALPPAVLAAKETRDNNPTLGAVFTSAIRMQEILRRDSTLRDYLTTAQHTQDAVTGLLVVEQNIKHGFGHALIDDKVVDDVEQTTVSFDQHRLLDLTSSEIDTRRKLKRRAFDYLLSLALGQVSEQRDERESLKKQQTLLRIKLDILQKGGSSFARDTGTHDCAALQTRLVDVEAQLAALGPVHEVLQGNLAIVAEVLANAEKHFWAEEVTLRVDKQYLLHSDNDTAVAAIPFHEVCDSNGRKVTLLLLSVSPDTLAASTD